GGRVGLAHGRAVSRCYRSHTAAAGLAGCRRRGSGAARLAHAVSSRRRPRSADAPRSRLHTLHFLLTGWSAREFPPVNAKVDSCARLFVGSGPRPATGVGLLVWGCPRQCPAARAADAPPSRTKTMCPSA